MVGKKRDCPHCNNEVEHYLLPEQLPKAILGLQMQIGRRSEKFGVRAWLCIKCRRLTFETWLPAEPPVDLRELLKRMGEAL